MVETTFSNFQEDFFTDFLKLHLNFWYQNPNMYEKSWGMKLWIGTGTWNVLLCICEHDYVGAALVTQKM